MTSRLNPHPTYRPDIDGLRAVAVLAVVLYHAFPLWGGGGFIGVDIFFVISGYLISTIIFAGVDAGTFSYADFYDRRIRRIFPALILVLITCLAFAVTLAFPTDARAIGQQMASGAGFVANLFFWNEAGYFDGDSELKPLLHLWSLSVEEQYYIVWPLVVGLLWKRRRLFLPALLLLAAASFALNVISIATGHQDAAFYSPLSRAWELLLGSWLAYHRRLHPAAQADASRRGLGLFHGMSVAGALLISIGLLVIRPNSAFPGWWALLPTLGALCLIGAGPQAWFNRTVLSNRLFVFFGKISYPLYLWHWPLLAFPKIYSGAADRNIRITAVIAAVALAWLTWRWLETPIRHGARRASIPIVLAGTCASLAACGGLLIASDGWLNRLPPDMRDISRAQAAFDYRRYRTLTCFLAADQRPEAFAAECDPPVTPGVRRLTLWGDSHAASFYPGLQALMAEGRRFDLGQFTAAACPPVLGMSIRARPHCRATNDAVWKRLSADPPDTVLLAANWTFYNGQNGWEQLDLQALEATARRLRQAGVRHVVVIGPLARWVLAEPLVLLREWRDDGAVPLRSLKSFNAASFGVDQAVRGAAHRAGVDFISPVEKLCDPTGCLQTVTSAGRRYPIAWDDAHLTIAASEILVRAWLGPWLAATEGTTR